MSAARHVHAKSRVPPDLIERRCAHIIDLSAVRAAMGTLWSVMQGSVRSRLESVITKGLTSADYYERLDEERYLIVTPNAPAEEGATITLKIASEFLNALNGSCDLRNVHIETAEQDGAHIVGRLIEATALAELIEKAGITDVTVPPKLRRGASPQLEKPVSGGGPAPRSELRIAHRFEALWDARNQAITTYISLPDSITCAEEPDGQLAPGELTIRERTRLEMSGLMAGVAHLSRFLEGGERFLLCVPISFDMVCSPYGRMEFTATCRGLPGAFRQYLVFLLTDVPLGVTHSRLTDLAVVLKPYGRIIASVPGGCRNFSSYSGHGFSGLALDLAKSASDAERRADIPLVGAAGHDMGWGAAILNLDNPEMLAAVNAADFRFLHGKVVASPLSRPKPMTRLASASIMPPLNETGKSGVAANGT
jgi:hypothetical protein